MANPPIGESHDLFKNTPNYQVRALTDEVVNNDEFRYCGSSNALPLKTCVDTYDPLLERTPDGEVLAADGNDRSILWLLGRPGARYFEIGERARIARFVARSDATTRLGWLYHAPRSLHQIRAQTARSPCPSLAQPSLCDDTRVSQPNSSLGQ